MSWPEITSSNGMSKTDAAKLILHLNLHHLTPQQHQPHQCLIINTGTPKGCALSPPLYSSFTHDCTAHMPNTTLIKFADDITVNGLIIDDDKSDYRNEIELLVKWSNDNKLILNVNKTKEFIVDLRKCINLTDSIIINGSAVEQISIKIFFGLTVLNTLSWTQNADKIIKNRRQMFFLHILKSYNVNIDVMINFYCAVIERILTTNILVWFGCTNKR